MRASSLAMMLCLAVLAADPAHAEECGPLHVIASIALTPSKDGLQEFVPVTLVGKEKLFLLDTGGLFSEILPKTADELGLERKTAPLRAYSVTNEYSDQYVSAPFQLGRLKADRFDFMLYPEKDALSERPDVVGILAPDMLAHFDVDLDFGAQKLNLISQEHCPGRVLYWKSESVAVVPFTFLDDGHIVAPVKLDGHTEYALLDTGAGYTALRAQVAEERYGLKLGSPDTQEAGSLNGHKDLKTYSHIFSSLEFEGVSVVNPAVHLIPDKGGWLSIDTAAPNRGSRIVDAGNDESRRTMLIGMDVLRHFHLYIDYRDQKLYITPASTSAAAPPAEPAH